MFQSPKARVNFEVKLCTKTPRPGICWKVEMIEKNIMSQRRRSDETSLWSEGAWIYGLNDELIRFIRFQSLCVSHFVVGKPMVAHGVVAVPLSRRRRRRTKVESWARTEGPDWGPTGLHLQVLRTLSVRYRQIIIFFEVSLNSSSGTTWS